MPKVNTCEPLMVERIIPITIRIVKPLDMTATGFYVDDFQMERFWANPARYVPFLRGKYAVIGADFSVYSDMPRILALFNAYRNFWLSAYWQKEGVMVIPNITWPVGRLEAAYYESVGCGGIIAVSNVGLDIDEKCLFSDELGVILERNKPKKCLLYGSDYKLRNGLLPGVKPFDVVRKIEPFTPKKRMKQ